MSPGRIHCTISTTFKTKVLDGTLYDVEQKGRKVVWQQSCEANQRACPYYVCRMSSEKQSKEVKKWRTLLGFHIDRLPLGYSNHLLILLSWFASYTRSCVFSCAKNEQRKRNNCGSSTRAGRVDIHVQNNVPGKQG